MINYAVNYAFGSYLVRNYGGAELFQKIVQSEETDYNAVTEAVAAVGFSGETFTTLLQKWGAAVVLSDQTDQSSGYQYNTGSAFSSTLDGNTYTVGSVNMYNYDYGSLVSGPFFFTESSLSGLSAHKKLSNTYIKVGTAETGTFSATIDMAAGLTLTVVTKASN